MADYTYITETGVVVPDTSTLLADVEAEFRAALGADLVTTPDTPQGALIAAEVIARTGVLGNNAALANQINPNAAGGVFLDAIWALTGGGRFAATRSVVPGVELLGLAGTLIPSGSVASLADGTQFESVSPVVLDGDGEGSVDFQAVEPGPVACGVGALSQIVTAVLGWDSVTNPTAATLGRAEQTDQAARLRRKVTLAAQGVALPEAVTSALYGLPDVRSLVFRENVTDAALDIDGVTLRPHSIFVCVDGSTDAEVAAALLASKSLGADWNGTTEVEVVEPASNQTYTVRFSRPDEVAIQARLTVRNTGALTDVPASVRQAVLDYAAGLIEGEAGFVVGGAASPFEVAGAVARQLPGLYVQRCELSYASPTSWTTEELPITIEEIATIESGMIQVIVS